MVQVQLVVLGITSVACLQVVVWIEVDRELTMVRATAIVLTELRSNRKGREYCRTRF